MRPIREPGKPTNRLRFLLARINRDDRFASLVHRVQELGEEFMATPSMLEDAASVIAHKMRRQDYAQRQSVLEEE